MDIRHHYVEVGEGEPFILIHGNEEECGIFHHQIESFAWGYHVYALDTRGHGQTPRGTAPFTIRQFAEDLKCFMDEHGIDRANILGFSDGGNIALIFAMKYPERVNRLVINGANLDAKGVEPKVQRLIEIEYYFRKVQGIFSKKAKRKAEMLGLMVNDPNIRPEELHQIQAPTLVMAGTCDLILASETRRIAENIPDSRLVFIEGDHGIAHRNPEDYNRAVWEFMQES